MRCVLCWDSGSESVPASLIIFEMKEMINFSEKIQTVPVGVAPEKKFQQGFCDPQSTTYRTL
jgi:hypothetical protein